MKGGNAVDAACAMIAAHDHDVGHLEAGAARRRRSFTIRTSERSSASTPSASLRLAVTAAFYKGKGMNYPPEYGPLAAVTPGTPGGIMVMLAEYGKLSLKDVLAPAIEMADGYAMDDETSRRHRAAEIVAETMEVFASDADAAASWRKTRGPVPGRDISPG